jgi:hypothetical protein
LPQLLLIRWVQKGSPSVRTHDFTTYITGELSGGSVQKHVNEELDKFQKASRKLQNATGTEEELSELTKIYEVVAEQKAEGTPGPSDTACTHVVASEAIALKKQKADSEYLKAQQQEKDGEALRCA